jgi:O-antigen ligase
MMCVALLLCAGSIFVYYAIPSLGLVQAWNPEQQVWTAEKAVGEIGRMKGIVGTPNGVGFIAAFGIVLSVLYFRLLPAFGRWIAIVLVPAATVCLALSENRNSMFAVAIALWVGFVLRKGTGFKLVVTAALGLIGAMVLVVFSDQIFSLISRSGNANEVTSLTGRSEIWAVVIQKWLQQPIYGYGYTSALSILPLDPRLFHAAAHTHNMLLELLFSGGLILVALFLLGLGATIVHICRLGAVNEAALVAFFLVRGLTEPTPFGNMAGIGSFAFALALALVIAQLVTVPTRAVLASRERSLSAPGAVRVRRRSRLRPA